MKRRDFLNKLTIGTVGAAAAVTVTVIVGEILPPEKQLYSLQKLGTVDNFPLDDFSFIEEKKIYLQRTRTYLRALSGVCTHLGCTVRKSESGFQCPCHGSRYDKLGKPLSGPALRKLDRYKLSISTQGEIIVDLGELVDEDFRLV